jgi:hypothetical protein
MKHLIHAILLFALFIGATLSEAKTEPKTLTQVSLDELYPASPRWEPPTALVTSPPQVQFLSTFFRFLAVLRSHQVSSQRWFREDHVIYLLDVLSSEELAATSAIFNVVAERVAKGQTNINSALVRAGPEFLIAKIAKIDADVALLKDQHKDVIRFAVSMHEGVGQQTYRGLPYSYHLRRVRAVLKRFGPVEKSRPAYWRQLLAVFNLI